MTQTTICSQSTCSGNGQCHMYEDEGVYCTCDLGWADEDCSHNIDDCRPDSCSHSGECIDGVNEFRCKCPPDVLGQYCQARKSDFHSFPQHSLA